MTDVPDPGSDLSPERHAQIRDQIIARSLARNGAVGDERPVAVILAGQPGAGKSGLRTLARAELRASGGAVVVDTDDLRRHHPQYADFLDRDDRSAADKTQRDVSRWADALRDGAIAGRRNLIVDGTLKNPEHAQRLCERLRESGYRVEVRALAVSPEDSRLGVYLRYEEAHAKAGAGRWVPERVHDEAVAGVKESLRCIEQLGLADRVQVYHRGSDQPIYDNPAAREGGTDGAAKVIEAEHRRDATLDEHRDRETGWSRWQELAKTNANLDKPYAQRGLALQAKARQARIAALDVQYQAAKANIRLYTPEAQDVLAARAKAHRENIETIDRAGPDPSPHLIDVGKPIAMGQQLDREDR